VNGKLPAEELYDMETDLWMVNNLIAEPAHAAILTTLRNELIHWRNRTEDYNTSNTELSRRSIRYQVPGTPGGGGGDPDQGNAIINSSFELGNVNWAFNGGSAGHFAVPTLATDGFSIANIRGLHSSTSSSGLTQLTALGVQPGTFTLTFDAAKAPNGGAASTLNAVLYRGSPATVLASINVTVTASMQSFELVHNSGSDQSGDIGVRFLPIGSGNADNRIAIDKVILVFEAP
jgi:hypothetical protein